MENNKCLVSRSLRSRLEEDRVFQRFHIKPIQLKFTIVHFDEWSYKSFIITSIYLDEERKANCLSIRIVTERYNSITAQWNNDL